MARVTQVVLTKCKSWSDNRRKFKQNVPVTITDPREIAKFKANSLFSVREIEESRASAGISAEKINPGDPFKTPVSDESTRLPQRKKKVIKAAAVKDDEDEDSKE